MTVREFCLRNTRAHELVVIRDCGWIVATAWIDDEDIFRLLESVKNKTVIKNEWGKLSVVTEHGDTIEIPCHYIDC